MRKALVQAVTAAAILGWASAAAAQSGRPVRGADDGGTLGKMIEEEDRKRGRLPPASAQPEIAPPANPQTAEEAVARVNYLKKQLDARKITHAQFETEAKPLIEKYDLQYQTMQQRYLLSVTPEHRILYLVAFTLSGKLLSTHPVQVFDTPDRCRAENQKFIETTAKKQIAGRRDAWFMAEDTAVEFVRDKRGLGQWQVALTRCGPESQSIERRHQKMGIDIPALIGQANKEIAARGFVPN